MGAVVVVVVGLLLGLGALVIFVALPITAVIVGGLALSMLGRRDFVPITYNLRSLGVRKVSTFVTGLGLALVVSVFCTGLMLGQGIKNTLAGTGTDDNVKVMRKGAQSEVQSGVNTELARLVSSAPEIAIGTDGKPLMSSEAVVLIFALREHPKSDQDGSNVTVRGVSDRAFDVHPGLQIEGRRFTPGTSEIVVGKALSGHFQGMRLGEKVRFARRDWTVVGLLDAHGSGFNSEVWGDVDQFMDAFQRRGGVSSLTARLKDPGMVSALEARFASDPQMAQLELKRERQYYEDQSKGLALFIRFLGTFIAVVSALGAALGAMITMYAQVAARTREIGTLRALGFRRRAVLVSFVVESLVIGLVAGLVGVGAAAFWQFASFSTMNFQSFSEVTFRFVFTWPIAALSMTFAGAMGYAGGLLPALRAARMPIVDATRGG